MKATWEGWIGNDIPITQALDIVGGWYETQIHKLYAVKKVRVTVDDGKPCVWKTRVMPGEFNTSCGRIHGCFFFRQEVKFCPFCGAKIEEDAE